MMAQLILGVLLANFYEWGIHKYLLHGMGKNKKSFWSFHWKDHHNRARRDHNYDSKFYPKEVLSLQLFFILHAYFLIQYPALLVAMGSYAVAYYVVHRYAHHHPVWCKKYLRWHWDHHMGKDQDKNWCILFPLTDYIMGTRKKI